MLARLRDEFHTSRKFAQALLEHLDAARVTRRRPDDSRVPDESRRGRLRAPTPASRTAAPAPRRPGRPRLERPTTPSIHSPRGRRTGRDRVLSSSTGATHRDGPKPKASVPYVHGSFPAALAGGHRYPGGARGSRRARP